MDVSGFTCGPISRRTTDAGEHIHGDCRRTSTQPLRSQIPNVTAGTTYQYRIRAENDYGFSPYSAVTTATVPAAQLIPPPTNLQAAAVSQTQIDLTWSNANTNAIRFHIERKTGATGTYTEIATVPATATSYQDTTVKRTRRTRIGSDRKAQPVSLLYSSESSATTPALPLPPAAHLQALRLPLHRSTCRGAATATGIVFVQHGAQDHHRGVFSDQPTECHEPLHSMIRRWQHQQRICTGYGLRLHLGYRRIPTKSPQQHLPHRYRQRPHCKAQLRPLLRFICRGPALQPASFDSESNGEPPACMPKSLNQAPRARRLMIRA